MHRIDVLARHLRTTDTESLGTASLSRTQCLSVQPATGPVIIGGMVLDIQVLPRLLRPPSKGKQFVQVTRCCHQARPGGDLDLQRGGSVPGHIQQVCGGVARNVAECLGLLCRTDPHAAHDRSMQLPLLISVLGKDAAGEVLLAHWTAAGLPTQGIRCLPGIPTPCVAAIFDRGVLQILPSL